MNIKQKIKKNGQKVYTASLYLGTDKLTGKKIRTTITARTKKEVKLKAQQKLTKFNQNGQTVYKYKEVKITYYHELAEMWFENHKQDLKPNTVKSIRSKLDKHLLPAFGEMKLEKIRPIVIQNKLNEWAALARTKQKSNERKNGIFENYPALHRYNKAIMQLAVSLEIIDRNPCQNVMIPKRKRLESDRVQVLTKAELRQFIEYLKTREQTFENIYHTTLYSLLIATGCRIGEALALDWKDVDIDKRRININKTLNDLGEINDPKTESSKRWIDIDQDTTEMLRKYYLKQREEALKLRRVEKQVFSKLADGYPKTSWLRKKLHQAAKEAGLQPFGFHVFRHTHASLLLNAGVNYKELQTRLGHAKLATTMDTYGHMFDEKMTETAQIFSEAIQSI